MCVSTNSFFVVFTVFFIFAQYFFPLMSFCTFFGSIFVLYWMPISTLAISAKYTIFTFDIVLYLNPQMNIFMMKSAPKIFHGIEFFRFPGATKINNLGNDFRLQKMPNDFKRKKFF